MSSDKFPEVIVTDTRLRQEQQKTAVLRGAKQIYYSQFTASGADSNTMSFNCPSKTPHSEIDRNIQLLVPVRLTISIPSGVPALSYILRSDLCNFRSYPIHKALESMSMTINNEQFNVRLGPIVSALEHYNTSRRLKLLEFSTTPNYGTCHAQDFHDLDSGTRSGLTFFANSLAGISPQAFPFTVVSQTNVGGACVSVVDAVFIESLWLSPLHFGYESDNLQAIRGVKNLNFNFKWLENAGFRMIAVDDFGLGAVDPTISLQCSFKASDNFSYPDLSPKLLINYLEPQCFLPAVEPSYLERFELQTFTKTHSTSIAAGAQDTLYSDTIKLPVIPHKFFIFAERPLSTLTSSPYYPDVFFGIENIELEWNGINVLGTAHPAQLYRICVKNGLQLEYATWRGLNYNNSSAGADFGTTAQQFASTGTVLCLDIMDLGLSPELISANTNQYTLKVKVTAKNLSKTDTITPDLHVVVLTDYLVAFDNKQNQIDSRVKQPIVIFDEAKNCTTSQKDNAPGVKDLKYATRGGNWKELQHNIHKGDVFPF